jgi:hypothetical protein
VRATRTPRFRARAIVLAFATLLLGVLVPAPAADAAVLTGGASLSHPFSQPVWWPLTVDTTMDCYRHNPGCTIHDDWVLDVVSMNRDHAGQTAWEPVYAMGAGIAHWGVRADQKCGPGHTAGRGNWLWIDHGNGVISWYGHLAWPFTVAEGAYVTPKSKIAYIGNSGYGRCNLKPTLHYIDIAVKHGGKNDMNSGYYFQMKQLYACKNGVRKLYPDAFSRYSRWNDVPAWIKYQSTPWIPGSDRSCETIPPHTPTRTTTARLARAGAGTLRATWVNPTSGPTRRATVVLIREYHPSIHRWLDLRKHIVSPNATSTKFTGLHPKHSFRVRVYYSNWVGISGYSPWASAIAR